MLASFVPGKDKGENKRNEKNISSVFFGVDVLASVPTHKSKLPFGDIHTLWGYNPLRNLWFATAYLNTHEHLGFSKSNVIILVVHSACVGGCEYGIFQGGPVGIQHNVFSIL